MRGSDNPGFLAKLLGLLSPRERMQGAVLLGLMLVLALVEMVGVASIMPFLAVLGNPEVVETNRWLAWGYETLGFESTEGYLFALGLAAFVLVLASSGLKIAKTYALSRWTQNRNFAISARLLRSYLRQPYAFFLNRNSADLSKRILAESGEVVSLALRPLMELVSHGLVLAVLVGLLVVADPVVAGVVALVVGGVYGTLYLGIRRLLGRLGKGRVEANRGRYQAAGEAFGGIKDLKVLGREGAYLGRFVSHARRYARYSYLKAAITGVPRYAIEVVAFGGILGLALGLMATRGDLGTVLPILGLYAFAAYRLLPAAQGLFQSMGSLRFGDAALQTVWDDLGPHSGSRPLPSPRPGGPMKLRESIRFDDVAFTYPGAPGPALRGIEIEIPVNTSVGFVGSTGAGKTTAVDLILGLLEPTAGAIRIDGRPLPEVGIQNWQRILGYVPQHIYLADASVAENIALGIPGGQIDHDAVERAARVAQIHDFIEGQLPEGYGTEVGERGVRLSGGQRQRIGIARALYHDPQVLVLDEATSALDTATERSIMEAVESLSGQKTLIMIAHRLSTVERCDQIVVLEGGRAVGTGGYDELKSTNAVFRTLAVA